MHTCKLHVVSNASVQHQQVRRQTSTPQPLPETESFQLKQSLPDAVFAAAQGTQMRRQSVWMSRRALHIQWNPEQFRSTGTEALSTKYQHISIQATKPSSTQPLKAHQKLTTLAFSRPQHVEVSTRRLWAAQQPIWQMLAPRRWQRQHAARLIINTAELSACGAGGGEA